VPYNNVKFIDIMKYSYLVQDIAISHLHGNRAGRTYMCWIHMYNESKGRSHYRSSMSFVALAKYLFTFHYILLDKILRNCACVDIYNSTFENMNMKWEL
jgi:hypothetical protein